MREHVARLRKLLHEAADGAVVTDQERSARSNFEYFELFSPPALSVESTHRAKAFRLISRISNGYGWQAEVARFLDNRDASALTELDDDAVDQLASWMTQLEDCVQSGLGAPEMPPAT
jgi:hypothetical protein